MVLTDVARQIEQIPPPVTLGKLADVCREQGLQGHLVVLREPYLGRILHGTKTIESRFGKCRLPPFKCVASGDALVLKKSAGAIVGVAEVVRAEFHGPVGRAEIARIVKHHRRQLQFDAAFVRSIEGARYATLLHLGAVVQVESRRLVKSDLRAWVVLSPSRQAPAPPRQMRLPLDR